MPVASAPSTSKRLLALLTLLQSRRDWPARVLAERLGVSERTVRRDVDRLRELDYTVDATRGPEGGYRLGTGAHLPPLLLDDEQAVAVAIALQGAEALGAGIAEAADRAFGTISRTMPEHLARRVEALALAVAPSRGPAADPTVLLRIGAAIRASEELRFDYAAPGRADGDGAARRIEPHHLLLRGGRWYLIGWSADRGAWRTYRADRITPRMHTGRSFTPRAVPGGDPVAFLEARFRGSASERWPCEGEAVLRAPIAVVEPYLGDGTVQPLDEERCLVRLGAWSWRALAATIARFDAAVESAEPRELVAAFGELAERFERAGSTAAG